MRRGTSLLVRLAIAALVSGLAALLMVTVGPGFAEKPDDIGSNEHAAEQAEDTGAEQEASEGDAGQDAADASENSTSNDGASDVTAAGGPMNDPIDEGASTEPDSHGHIGAGTGTDEGSQADPGHKEDRNGTDGKTNGPGTGDSPGAEEDCGDNTDGSSADFSGNGANRHGPYDSTCDGRISQNGQGDDAPGGGTPCAGCVGKADNKQPPGQVMEFNGQKPNDMGYECDGNQGVGAHYGNGNPAHTGDCAENEPEEDCTGDTNPDNNDDCEPIEVCRMGSNGQWRIVTIRRDERLSTDLDAPASGRAQDCGEDDELIEVCRLHANGQWKIEKILPGERLSSDLDAPASGRAQDCAPNDEFIQVCRMQNGHWKIETIHEDDRLPGDLDAPASGKAKDCSDEVISICYQTSSGDWRVAEDIDADDIDSYRNARVVPKGTDEDECEEEEEVLSICYQTADGDWRVAEDIDEDDVDDYRNARVVPKGTDAEDCENDEVFCPDGTELAGREMPEDGNCNPTVVVTVCPLDSDRPMQQVPDGRTAAWCYDDEVQGEVIVNVPAPGMPKPNVQRELIGRPNAKGGLLPFTGASVLAFVVLALQLIAAGSLILRGRRA